MASECCASCVFGHVQEPRGRRVVVDITASTKQRECHRFPPAVFAAGNQIYNMFPVVAADTVCGEFKPVPELPPAA